VRQITELEVIMDVDIPEWVKLASWGAVGGAVVVTLIGFSAGWVITSGAAKQAADRKAEKAVISALTRICVAQFKSVPQGEQKTHIAALEKGRFWEQSDYVESHGWATMPGGTKPNEAVAEACVSELLKA
jgi:hypothetical protein